MGGDTDHAAQFFSAYFHQDCLLDDPDWQAVVLRFRQSEPFALVRTTQVELETLLAKSNEASLAEFLFGPASLSYFDPRASGLSLTGWLQQIVDILAGGSPRTVGDAGMTQARREAALIAKRVLQVDFDPILASRQLGALRWSVGVPEDDSDFTTFVAIASETDSLPVDPERHQWSAEALARLEPEIFQGSQLGAIPGAPSVREHLAPLRNRRLTSC